MSYVEFKNVSKTYKTGDVSVEALKDASFEIGKGEICVIVGQSGAGKTTLLNILGGMEERCIWMAQRFRITTRNSSRRTDGGISDSYFSFII